MSLNHELAKIFSTMAALMEIKGESVFKAIAFGKVGRLLENMTEDIRDCVEQGTLCDIEGVGASSQKVIEEYVKTGRSTDYEELAVRLAGAPSVLEGYRCRLDGARATAPLFDSRRFTRHLERAYRMMWERHAAGLPPISITVPPITTPSA